MGVWETLTGQFIDVIDWEEKTRDTIIWKFSRNDNEIKNGAQLIVRQGQEAVFIHEGKVGDIFKPGRHVLSTDNLPILTTFESWQYAFDSPFKCDVYFVSTRQFTDLKWGTKRPIMLRDPEFGPIRLRAFGSYSFQVKRAGRLIRQIAGTGARYRTEEITGQLRNILVSRFADALGEADIPMLDLAANYNEIGGLLKEKLQPEFTNYGIVLTQFLIENISLPKEVEEALDKRAKMGIIGNMGQYTQYQTAEAMADMAKNPGVGGNMMGVVAGVNMGNVVGGAMSGTAGATQLSPAGPPPLPSQTRWFAAIDGKQTGPLDPAALGQQISTGAVTRDTLVWKEGMAGWTPAGDVPELSGRFGAAPPPLPPG